MTEEQERVLHEGKIILRELGKAIDGHEPRATLFALSAFVVATLMQTGTPLEDFIAALHAADKHRPEGHDGAA